MKKFLLTLTLLFCIVANSQRTRPTIDPITDPNDPSNPYIDPTNPNPILTDNEVGLTEGQLSVSLSGAATYNIPIAVPPGLVGVAPQISLSYSSQGGNGNAGYGWGISGISMITRIPSTTFHDRVIDGVDFDNLDRFALDGQRLIIKTGTSGVYGADGTMYETENFSNIEIITNGISLYGSEYGPLNFIVKYPDGSQAHYGSVFHVGVTVNYLIDYWQNAQGVRISYEYNFINNNPTIKSIKYGSPNSFENNLNEISFVYKNRLRPENYYVGGFKIENKNILTEINVKSNNVGFRNYKLTQNVSSLGYERLISITEKTGDNTLKYKPLMFNYEDTIDTVSYSFPSQTYNVNNINYIDYSTVSGYFNQTNNISFILFPKTGANKKTKYRLFDDLVNNPQNSIEHEVGKFEEIFTSSFLDSENKLLPFQGWCVVQKTSNIYTAKIFSKNTVQTPITLNYQKNITFPSLQTTICQDCNVSQSTITLNKKFLNGDFNGDGLTDLIALDIPTNIGIGCSPIPHEPQDCRQNSQLINSKKAYFIDLKTNNTTNYTSIVGELVDFLVDDPIINVLDFNGDGKSDFMVITEGKAIVYSLNNQNQLEILTTENNENIKLTMPMLLGDYNGDGKSDFITPIKLTNSSQESLYAKFMSDGKNFTSSTNIYNIPNLFNPNWQRSYIANDMNGDGKTDLVYVITGTNPNGSSFANITIYKNTLNDFTSSNNASNGTNAFTHNVQPNPLPIFIASNYLNKKQEIAFFSGNTIHYFQSTKDANKDRLITKITNGNGVQDRISYKPLIKEDNTNNYNIFTPTILIEEYPKTDIVNAPTIHVVSKLEKQSLSTYKKQLFTYYGAVSEISGLGFLGFRGTMKTGWFDDNQQIISSISKNDINLRGAKIEGYTKIGLENPWSTTPQSGFITKNINVYNKYDNLPFENPLQSNKIFKLNQTKNIEFNGLENTQTEAITKYDSYSNPSEITTTLKNNNVIEQISKSNVNYENTISNGIYIIGRPIYKLQINTIYPSADETGSEEIFSYQNNLLNQIKRRNTNSNLISPFITEDNIYDEFGNLTEKIITATGLAPRKTLYEYNPSAPFYSRFLTKSTDIEGLETLTVYNPNNGTLISETNPYGLTTLHFYDKWFKKTKITDYLDKNKYFIYERLNQQTKITTKADDNSESFELFDDLGRKEMAGTKSLNDNFSSVSYLYDVYDRNIATSEPYFDYPEQWNTTRYDDYGRPILMSLYTGKNISTNYDELTTTVNDGLKTKSSTKNAKGLVVSLTDNPGGTIYYKYFANGSLRQTIFDNAVITIEQDGFGRKIKLTDPSAGILKYEYNLFGETTKESKINEISNTPSGLTEYEINDFGKVISKTVKGFSGDPTNTKTLYTFNPSSKLLTNISFEDFANSNTTNYNYGYDSYNRLNFTDESSIYAYFQQATQFDNFGRVYKELSTAIDPNSGKRSDKWIRYEYKNGIQFQVFDDENGVLLHQINNVDARSNTTDVSLGEHMLQTNTFDQYGLIEKTDFTVIQGNFATGIPFQSLSTNFESLRGNLLKRYNSYFNITDSFEYDSQDRLTKYPDTNGNVTSQNYDDKGKITNNKIGDYAYTIQGKPYQVSSITPPFQGAPSESYYQDREQNVLYNFFKSPISISVFNKESIDIEYNTLNQRSTMFYGGTSTEKSDRKYRKSYSADGTMEIKIDNSTGETEFITYINGDGYSAPLVLKSNGDIQEYLYLHRDYQGTILAITADQGQILESRFFDAWGNITHYYNSNGVNTLPIGAGDLLLDRGYTGHEHLLGVELINMNARLYDPLLHRFLQPDNFVQDPSNTQNYNRYAYCINNPLKYVDFNGENFNEWWQENWRTVVTVVAAVGTGVIIVASLETATPFVVAAWAGAGTGFVGGTVGTALNGGTLLESLRVGLISGVTGAVFGVAGAGISAAAGFVGIVPCAISGGIQSSAFNGLSNLINGRDFNEGIGFSAILGTFTGGASGLAAARASGSGIWFGTSSKPSVSVIASKVDAAAAKGIEDMKTNSFKAQAKNTTINSTVSNETRLFRGGDNTQLSTADLRSGLNKNTGLMQPGKGLSTNTNKLNKFVDQYGGAFEVNLKSIPKELNLINSPPGSTHFLISPIQPMTPAVFQNYLNQVQLNKSFNAIIR